MSNSSASSVLVFSIFDNKMERYGDPFVSPSVAVAERSLVDFLRSPQSKLYQDHPHDFELVQIGTFDSVSGVLNPVSLDKAYRCGLLYLLSDGKADFQQLQAAKDFLDYISMKHPDEYEKLSHAYIDDSADKE